MHDSVSAYKHKGESERKYRSFTNEMSYRSVYHTETCIRIKYFYPIGGISHDRGVESPGEEKGHERNLDARILAHYFDMSWMKRVRTQTRQ